MDWFKHDVTAQMDIKIKKLVRNYGYEGYGVYWNVIELLYSKDGQMEVNELIEELDLTDNVKYVEVLERFGLIEIEDSIVRNRRVMAAISENDDRRKRFSDMGKASAEHRLNKSSAKVKRTLNTSSTDVERTLNPCSTDRKIDREIDITNSELRSSLVCSEPSENGCRADSDDPVFLSIITNEKTGYPIRESDVERWTDAFPGVDVRATLKRIGTWSHDNPTKRKTSKGMMRFICNWLSKEQDRAGRIQITQPEVIKGTNIKMAITADGSNPDRYKNSPTMEELYQMTRSGK